MKSMLDIQIPDSNFSMQHGDKVVLLGSCFSDNLVPHFENAGYLAIGNPAGTIFHPSAIATILTDAIAQNTDAVALNRGDLWFDWRTSGQIFGYSEEQLQQKVSGMFESLHRSLKESKLLLVTFGTAWGYRLESGKLVGNCHKMSGDLFQKELTSLRVLLDEWKSCMDLLKEFNPALNIVYTISPVRHVRDGLIENNRSKARLIELVHNLPDSSYFPSYEIVNDVLRDYRYFNADLVHPNSQAIEVVWDALSKSIFDEETRNLNEGVMKLNKMKSHNSLYPNSADHQKFLKDLEVKESELREENPAIYFK